METSKKSKRRVFKGFLTCHTEYKNQSDSNIVEQLFNYSINIIKEFFTLSTVEQLFNYFILIKKSSIIFRKK